MSFNRVQSTSASCESDSAVVIVLLRDIGGDVSKREVLKDLINILSVRRTVMTRRLMDLFISLTKQKVTCHYFGFFC